MLPVDLGGIIHISVRGSFLDADHPATGSKLHACSHMPADIVDQINMATKGFGEDPTVKDQLAKMSSKFKYMPTKEAQDYVAEADMTLEKLAKDLGLAKQ